MAATRSQRSSFEFAHDLAEFLGPFTFGFLAHSFLLLWHFESVNYRADNHYRAPESREYVKPSYHLLESENLINRPDRAYQPGKKYEQMKCFRF
jgi:hypothetical protein